MEKSGFTLAEVLITLAIIGVVASLTIPSVVQNYKKTQTVTQLKKAYSALANTTNLAIAEHGPIIGWDVGDYSGSGSVDFTDKYLIPYLKVSKNCKDSTTGLCKFEYNALNKAYSSTFGASLARFYLNDGTFIAVSYHNSSEPYPCNNYIDIYIDINGQKKPNTYGKDLFRFNYWICYPTQTSANNGKFTPAGVPLTRSEALTHASYGCNKNADGIFCPSVILYDGWQIKDDYPWN